jgi:hypothetical protein
VASRIRTGLPTEAEPEITLAEQFKTLTGKWLGRFGYADASEVVPFEAELADVSGSLSGDIIEPNTFRPDMGATLQAVLTGEWSGDAVNFVKRYLEFTQPGDPVYAGRVNAALTRIEGTWSFPRHPWVSGPFSMMRKPFASARQTRLTATEVPETVSS